MSLFARLKAASQMVFANTRYWHWLLPRTSYNYAHDVGDGLRSSVLVAVLFWIMRRFAEAKMVVERDDEAEHEHELLDLLRRPNPFYSGRLLRMAMSLSYNVDGNAYAIKLRNAQRKPVQLWYAPHWLMEPHWPESGLEYIDYYNYSPQGVPIKIDVEDVVHVRFGLDPSNTRKGLAPLRSLVREVFTDDEAANFVATLLKNFGVPGLIISPGADDATMEKETPQSVKDFFKKTFGGEGRGEPLVMKSKTEVKSFGFNPQEMDLGRLRDIPEERVCAVLGVHAAVVGFGTGMQQTKVGATMKELRESAYEDCIIPMQNTFADEFDLQLLPDFEVDVKGVHVGFDLSDVRVLQEDENKHAERVRGLVKDTLLTMAEGRAELGYEVRPEHHVWLQQFSVTVVPEGELVPEEEEELEPEDDDDDDGGGAVDDGTVDDGNGDGKISGARRLKFVFPVVSKGTGWRERLVQALYVDWRRLSDVWEKELEREFKRLGRAIRAAWERLVEERGVETLSVLVETKVDVSLDDVYAALLVEGVDFSKYAGYAPQFMRVSRQTYSTIENILGLGVNLTDQAEMRIIAAGGTRRGLIDLSAQTKRGVFRAFAEARAVGEGAYAAGARIESMVAAGPWSSALIRGRVIGRTETKFAQNVSSLEAYRSGGVERVEIVDGQLDSSCVPCMERDGTTVTIEEAWALDEHPNGTLSWAPVIAGAE